MARYQKYVLPVDLSLYPSNYVRAVWHTVGAMMANRSVVTRPTDEEMADDHGKESKQHRRLHLNLIVLAMVRLY